MTPDKAAGERTRRSLTGSFERYLQDKGKGRGGDGGNYRRNAARELERFAEWAAGDWGDDDWTGIVPDDVDRKPTFEDLDERVFREYARHLAGDRGLKQNTVQTYYRYISAWCGWCVNEGYLEAHYAQRASAMAPLPEDDGRKPGDQQAWTSEQRHALTRHVDERARDAVEAYTTPPEDTGSLDKQRARHAALKAARDRTLVFVLHDIDQAARYADRMVALKDGAIYERGTPEEVVTEELLAEVFEIDAEVELTERGPQIVPLRPRHDDETEAQRDRTEVSQ
jgi:hypothetical protein